MRFLIYDRNVLKVSRAQYIRVNKNSVHTCSRILHLLLFSSNVFAYFYCSPFSFEEKM